MEAEYKKIYQKNVKKGRKKFELKTTEILMPKGGRDEMKDEKGTREERTKINQRERKI